MRIYKVWLYPHDPVNERFWWYIEKNRKHYLLPGYECGAQEGPWQEVPAEQVLNMISENWEYSVETQCFNSYQGRITMGDILERVSRLVFLIEMGPRAIELLRIKEGEEEDEPS